LGPTFGWPPRRLLLLPAGGTESLIRASENAEDDTRAAEHAVRLHAIGSEDVVVGLAASGTTPYTLTLLTSARTAGALTIGIASNPETPLLAAAEHPVLIATGAEPIAGSTRLKAGTAQKVTLNLFSTVLMMLLNRVYRGRMVDLEAGSAKLRRRAIAIVQGLSGAPAGEAERLFGEAGGNVKRALLLAQGLTPGEAELLLQRHSGNLRRALAELAARHV
ncbi:MAG: N-acetylmuramic acid 6-phosphate etherase, partial [Acetobacteraceae bacterium]